MGVRLEIERLKHSVVSVMTDEFSGIKELIAEQFDEKKFMSELIMQIKKEIKSEMLSQVATVMRSHVETLIKKEVKEGKLIRKLIERELRKNREIMEMVVKQSLMGYFRSKI